MKRSLYTLLYAALLGLVCAGLLTAARELTAERQKANRQAERVRHILDVLGIERKPRASSEELLAIYEKNVRERRRGDLLLYECADPGGNVQAVAVHFEGPGLWGPIKGFLALEPDMRTVRRVTFYEQEETPGLGGEISTKAFRKRFEKRRIVSPAGEPGIKVDAISGATMTSNRVERMLNRAIRKVLETEAEDER